jgi:hypothetical protein
MISNNHKGLWGVIDGKKHLDMVCEWWMTTVEGL